MQGSINIAPYGKDGPYDVMFGRYDKQGAMPKYRVNTFPQLEDVLKDFNITLTPEQIKKLASDGVSIQHVNAPDDVLKRYGLI